MRLRVVPLLLPLLLIGGAQAQTLGERVEGTRSDAGGRSLVLAVGPASRPGAYRWSVKAKRVSRRAVVAVVGGGRFTLDARGKPTKASGALVVAFVRRQGPGAVWRLRIVLPGSYTVRESGRSLLTLGLEVVSATGSAKAPCAADPSGRMRLFTFESERPALELRRLCEMSLIALDGEERGTTVSATIRKTG